MAGYDGTWDTVTRTPMGDQTATLTLSTEGDVLRGTRGNEMGSVEIENGQVSGDHATWTMNLTVPFPMSLAADVTLDGDTMSGMIQAGAFGASPITGTRRG